jgi:alkylation response protein AidB-like acyl-CoA dehydrogenase
MILTQEQEMIRDSMRAFAQERLAPFAAEWDRDHTFPAQALKELGELGALGMVRAREWGGAGMDYMSLVLTLEEIAAGDGATSTIVSVQNSLACGIINKYGTDAQKEEWLKPLARGEKLGCFCLTEPHTGSDASPSPPAPTVTATLRAQRRQALHHHRQARPDGHRLRRHRQGRRQEGHLLLPGAHRHPGYSVARVERKMGQHASDTCQIVFDNCRVPATALLGKEGEGYKIALSNLEAGASASPPRPSAWPAPPSRPPLRYAKERQTFGVPIIEHQAVNFRLADMATQLDAARLMVWRAASSRTPASPA